MTRLFFILLPVAATALAGSAVVGALTAGYEDLAGILTAAALGAIVSVPVAWAVARRLA
jgi:hypothetical protein